MYDLIIIGGGPAGVAAGVYAARKKLKTLLVTESFGGQSVVSADIQNWIGEEHISGIELAEKFEKHIRAHSDVVDIKSPERVTEIIKKDIENGEYIFEIKTDKGESHEGKAVILALGARRRKLGIPGEDKLNGRGVVYCSTCDAPIFNGKQVVVVGGGNAGLEAVHDLFPYATKIYLLVRGDVLKGDAVTQEVVKKNPKVEIIMNVVAEEIIGEKFVNSIRYRDTKSNEEKTLSVEGVFIEIGSIPNSEIVKNLVQIDAWGQVVIDSKHGATSLPGVFAAGDITDDPYKQNNISAGDAVKAALAAHAYLLKRKKESPAAADKL